MAQKIRRTNADTCWSWRKLCRDLFYYPFCFLVWLKMCKKLDKYIGVVMLNCVSLLGPLKGPSFCKDCFGAGEWFLLAFLSLVFDVSWMPELVYRFYRFIYLKGRVMGKEEEEERRRRREKRKRERGRGRERYFCPFPGWLLGQDEARICFGLHSGHHGYQRLKYLDHHLSPSQAY